VQHVPHVERGQHVEDRQVRDVGGVVEPGPERDERAAVVTGQREPVVPEGGRERDDVVRHRALVVAGGGLAAGAVPAQVRADDGVMSGERGRDVAPHQVRLREAVQEHDGRAAAADRGVQRDAVGDGDVAVFEAFDHGRQRGRGRSAIDQRH
jgi:hypothetical protein